MASGAEEFLQDSGSAMMTNASQLQWAGQWEAVADGLCPICLNNILDAAYIDICFHAFCFGCIQRWAATRAVCPLCRRPFSNILHTVRADNDYQQYVVGSSTRQQRTMARQRVRSRSPQQRYNLRPRPSNEPGVRTRGPARRDGAALGNAFTQQAVVERPVNPLEGSVNILVLRMEFLGFVNIE